MIPVRAPHILVVLSNVFESPTWLCTVYIREKKIFFSMEEIHFITLNDWYHD